MLATLLKNDPSPIVSSIPGECSFRVYDWCLVVYLSTVEAVWSEIHDV